MFNGTTGQIYGVGIPKRKPQQIQKVKTSNGGKEENI